MPLPRNRTLRRRNRRRAIPALAAHLHSARVDFSPAARVALAA